MLPTLDRHIARQYLFNVVALVVLLFSFVVAIDVMLNLDEYMDRAAKIDAESGRSPLGSPPVLAETQPAPQPIPAPPSTLRRAVITVLLIFDLWWPRLLQLFSYTIGLCLVGAMGFTFTQLVRHREMVAVLAGGVSLHRVLVPVLAVAALMMGLKVVDQELILSHPRIAPLLARTPADAGKRELGGFQVPLTADGRGQLWFARAYEPRTGVLSGVEVWKRDARGVVTERISADEARWKPAAHGVTGAAAGWELVGAKADSAQLVKPGTGTRAGVGSGAAAASPSMIPTDLEPSTLLFRRFASYRESLSWVQIGQMLASPHIKPDLREQLQRIRWGRVSTILSGLLSLAVTMPFFLMREPRNMLVQSLKCAPVGIVTMIGGTLLTALPIPGLPPGFAVFLPVLILLPIVAAVLGSLRT